MIDEGQIRLWWSIFRPDNELEEVRLLRAGGGTLSGYFTDIDTLVGELRKYADDTRFNVYFVMNEINAGCYFKRQRDRLEFVGKGETTDDSNITRRKWLLIDIDPSKRIDGVVYKDINSSDNELMSARNVARTVFDYLQGKGFPMPVTTLSGNGIHLYFRIDEPNDSETTELITNFLKSLGQKFSTSDADVDEGVWTLARLSKMYGTIPHKGADTPERPCRMARIEYVPENIEIVSHELIKSVADEYDDPKKREKELKELRRQQNQSYYNDDFPEISVREFLDSHGIAYREPEYDSKRGAMKYDLMECPWESEHTTHSEPGHASIWEYPSGHKDFHCFHGHCSSRGWTEFWQFYDPNLYKDAWREQRQQMPSNSQVPIVVPTNEQFVQSSNKGKPIGYVDENAEFGKKWYFTSDVEMFDPSKAVVIKTGFDGIDKTMYGVNLGEVTLLTGGNGAGKSSWLNTLILNVIDNGYKVALWSRELPASMEVYWLSFAAAGKNYLTQSSYGSGKMYIQKHIKEKIDKWLYGKFFLYNNYYPAKWRQLEEDLMRPIEMGCKLILLDNLFSMNISEFGNDKYENQTELINTLCAMAKRYGIHILLVAHPRKLTGYIRKVDISGSADLANAVDNIWILHRNNLDFRKAYDEFYKSAESKKKSYQNAEDKFKDIDTVFEIAKNRFWGVVDYTFGMHYDTISRRFMNSKDENRIYGWQDNPVQATMQFGNSHDMPFANSEDKDAPF